MSGPADQNSLHDSLTGTYIPSATSPSAIQPQASREESQVQSDHGGWPQQFTLAQHHSLPERQHQPEHHERQERQAPESSAASQQYEQPVHHHGLPEYHGSPEPQNWNMNAITAEESADALQQAEYGVEVAESESDPGYETDASIASVSLASSARHYIYENGRRYHSYRDSEGQYSFPNDEPEQDREDLKHAMYLKLFNKNLHFAPLDHTGSLNTIDLGTGTGIWAIDFADQFENASVLGIDLSPIQTPWVPPNLKFLLDDAESEWLYPSDHFDYVHTRHTIQAFRNWPNLFSNALTHLKPGAWMECQEIDHFPRSEDGTLAPDNAMIRYWDEVANGLASHGVKFRAAPQLMTMMQEAGFINVTQRIFFTPIGAWPQNRALKEVGVYWRAVLMEGLEAIALRPLTGALGWSKEEVEVFLASVRKAYMDRSTHAYMPFYVTYGQKPPRR